MRSRRRPVLVASLLALGAMVGCALVRAWWPTVLAASGEPANTVAQVREGLARQPAAWLGRTVLVRGVAQGRCGFPDADGRTGGCALAPAGMPFFGLIDVGPYTITGGSALRESLPLLLLRPPAEPLPARTLHRIGLGDAARHDALRWQQVATYRVRLRLLQPCTIEGTAGPCAVAALQL